MWTQFKVLIGLRWTLLRRMWTRSASGMIAGAMVLFLAVALLALALGVGFMCFMAGWKALPEISHEAPSGFLFVGDALVLVVGFLWLMGMVTELQRTDLIDFRKMLYLPVSLRMVFILNFAASLLCPLTVFYTLGAIGLTAGLAVGLGARMLWVFPLAVAFYLMVAAWSYHVQGRLVTLMENKRRRRLILTVIPVLLLILFQLPNLVTQTTLMGSRHGRHHPPQWTSYLMEATSSKHGAGWLLAAHEVIPLGWAPAGLFAATQRSYAELGLNLAGLGGLAALGLVVGYRATYRHYTGTTDRKIGKRKSPRTIAVSGRAPFTAQRVPFVDEDTGALALANWLALARHPRIRIQMFSQLIIPLIIAAPVVMRHSNVTFPFASELVYAGVVFFALISFMPYLTNQFGVDQEGFQALLLLPTPRYKYLLAKNLAFLPLACIPYLLLALVAAYAVRGGALAFVASVVQFIQVYFSVALVGNFLSIYFPYRVQRTTTVTTRLRPASMFVVLITLLTIPVLILPTWLCAALGAMSRTYAGWHYVPLGLVASVVVLLVTVFIYRASLETVGKLLATREQSILLTLLKDKD